MSKNTPRKFIIVDDNTIHEVEDPEAQRSKKRQRTELNNEYLFSSPPRTSNAAPADQSPTSGFTFRCSLPSERDPIYFNPDEKAQCYIKVEGVLFKVRYTGCLFVDT